MKVRPPLIVLWAVLVLLAVTPVRPRALLQSSGTLPVGGAHVVIGRWPPMVSCPEESRL